jgi:hypothetical protein
VHHKGNTIIIPPPLPFASIGHKKQQPTSATQERWVHFCFELFQSAVVVALVVGCCKLQQQQQQLSMSPRPSSEQKRVTHAPSPAPAGSATLGSCI